MKEHGRDLRLDADAEESLVQAVWKPANAPVFAHKDISPPWTGSVRVARYPSNGPCVGESQHRILYSRTHKNRCRYLFRAVVYRSKRLIFKLFFLETLQSFVTFNVTWDWDPGINLHADCSPKGQQASIAFFSSP